MPVSVDIVLPCYNPNDTWHQELIQFYNETKANHRLHFIVVNDGSVTANITAQVESLQQQQVPLTFISYSKNQGKGHALRKGVAASQNDYVLYTDIDFPFTQASMLSVLNALVTDECDIAAGYRSQNYYGSNMPFYRKMLSKTFRFFLKNVLGMVTSDTQCGLKGFNQKGKQKFLATRINRYLFDFEFIYTSSKDASLRIKTIAVQLKDNVVFSRMKLKILIQETFNLLFVLLFRRR